MLFKNKCKSSFFSLLEELGIFSSELSFYEHVKKYKSHCKFSFNVEYKFFP